MTGAELGARRRVYAAKLDAAARTLVDTLRGVEGIERISVFGSYARGRRDLSTDLDVLIVWDTPAPFLERLRALYSIVQVPVDLDLVCYTPAELERLREEPFFRRLSAEELVLYEKKPA